ncbi:lambda integrase-like protein [Paraburkholderia eburnea]|uniref:Lambda integrase-like protein n=1 Tax=Paraburkholderia eburnea TaxID=1189126 RepID=A0A2S4MJG2_9BURK|nr:phage integrase Arm DNA-binding domain-containing protein [Paraburkholderia eburnea]POR54527.1 lambda integrase-like protein [Paraburkholderia eburnea]PRZ19742.1 lambda integrase-like protein [Paraburkholderia eburnea]
MAARPRIRRRANWPENLHEPRPGYYVWRDPRSGKSTALGRMPLEQAIFEVVETNAKLKELEPSKRLADRISMHSETMADLLERMPVGKKANTVKARKYLDKAIREAVGQIRCDALTTKHVAEMLTAIEARGAMRMALQVRSRVRAVCRKGMALGWMDKNPADPTERPEVKVQRQRLSLEAFNAIFAKAPEVALWLQNAMLLALVSGQDRSTIGRWERSFSTGSESVLTRVKTGVRIAIPNELRMDAIGLSLADVIARCRSTGVVSKYLIHHIRGNPAAPKGSAIKLKTISQKFTDARRLAGIPDERAPTFHEIRSLSKRLYLEQGNVDTKALLGHLSDSNAELYADLRDLEPIKVKVN